MFRVDVISLNSESEAVEGAGAAVPLKGSYGHTKMFPPLNDGSAGFCTSSFLSEVLNHELGTKLVKRVEYTESL